MKSKTLICFSFTRITSPPKNAVNARNEWNASKQNRFIKSPKCGLISWIPSNSPLGMKSWNSYVLTRYGVHTKYHADTIPILINAKTPKISFLSKEMPLRKTAIGSTKKTDAAGILQSMPSVANRKKLNKIFVCSFFKRTFG